MLKNFIIFILLTLSFTVFSQEIKLQIIEKKGTIDIKIRDGKWSSPEINDILTSGTEIFTGFHSQLSIQIGDGAFITVNQLSNIVIENVLTKINSATINITLKNGYIVVFSKSKKDFKNKVIITLDKGNVEFNKAGGEIFARANMGIFIRAFEGHIKIGSKLTKIYFITKGEMCAINKDGKLIENDYYLRRGMTALPGEILNQENIEAYYDLLFQPYTEEPDVNDYYEHTHP